ncbi:MAG: T9SS type A sorting domain-containing protein [bacterium]|nr:T9SS type A sorting domain-containing protein [bacterium]
MLTARKSASLSAFFLAEGGKKIFIGLMLAVPLNLFATYWTIKYTGTVSDISFPDSLNGWAALGGDGGGIFTKGKVMCTKDGGENWTVKNIYASKSAYLGSGCSTTHVAFVDSNFGWAGGSWSTNETISGYTGSGWYLALTEDGFNTYSSSRHSVVSHYQGGGITNMETAAGKLFRAYFNSDAKSMDCYINNKWMSSYTMSICFIDAYRGWVCCEGRLFGTTTGVDSLSPLYNFPMNDIDFIDSLHGWAVGNGGAILYTDKCGVDSIWDTLTSGVTNNLRCVKFVDSLNGWVGGDGIILRTRDGGQNWVTEYSDLVISKICAVDTNYAWALYPYSYYKLGGFVLKYHPYVGVEEPLISDRACLTGRQGLQNAELKIIKNKISLSVPNSINTNIKIYDLCGREKETIYSGTLSKGNYTFTPNIHKSGVYFVRLTAGNYNVTKKLTIIK